MEFEQEIEQVYVDFDGVLSAPEARITTNLSRFTGISTHRLNRAFAECGEAYLLGQPVEEFLIAFSSRLDKEVTIKQLARAYAEVPFSRSLINIIYAMRQQGYSMALLSNNSKFRFDILKDLKILDVWKVFDEVHLSSEEKRLKENFVEDLIPETGLFIDDSKTFLDYVEALGGRTIHYNSSQHKISDLQAALEDEGILLPRNP